MPLSLEDASAVLHRFGLPPARGLRAMPGGLSHELYQVRAADGASYALKRLVAHTHRREYAEELDRAWAVERRMAAAGVPMPRPVADPATGRGWLRVVGLGMFRLHEYVEGARLGGYAEDPLCVEAAGGLLARVHLAAEPAPPETPDLAGFSWTEAAALLGDANPATGRRVREALPVLERLTAELSRDPLVLRPALATHRDVDPKNVLRRPDGSLVLLDWDVAAPADPCHELTTAALDWAGAVDRRFDPGLGDRFLRGYVEAGGPARLVADGVGIWLLQYLRWLEYGVRQCAIQDGVRQCAIQDGVRQCAVQDGVRQRAVGAGVRQCAVGAGGLPDRPSGPGAATAGGLPDGVPAGVVDWGLPWAQQTLADLPAIREWVAVRAGGA